MECPFPCPCYRMRVVVVFTEAELDAACGASVTRRDVSEVYMSREVLEEAMEESSGSFDNVSYTHFRCRVCTGRGKNGELSDDLAYHMRQ